MPEFDLSGNTNVQKNGVNQPSTTSSSLGLQKNEFLHDLSPHQIARVFTDFKQDKRTLIVPIGFPQAGKSLMLSSLMYYARKGNDTLFRTNLENAFPFNNGRIVVDQMIDYFDKGKLYEANALGSLDLIGINLQPTKGNKLPNLQLAFLDISGEDVKKIKTNEGARFTEKINAVFNGIKVDNSSIIFILITPYQPPVAHGESIQNGHDREDALHYDFLNYIKIEQSELLRSAKFFVVVSQWDKNPNENESVENYIREKRPSIYNYVKNTNVVWGQYSVGKLLSTYDERGIKLENIVRINYEYPARFWKKLYQICTNKSLENKSWFEKLI